MQAVFRVDSSFKIGSGHVMRCLTMANELRANGVKVIFICREHAGNLIKMLEDNEYLVLKLPKIVDEIIDSNSEYSSWIGTSIEQDAFETLELLSDATYDWMIVDHYSLDYKWEKIIRHAFKRILVIDDLANRIHDCDYLLDQNYTDKENRNYYHDLVPQKAICLLGPKYALINPIYSKLRNHLPFSNGVINRVLVFFGASDAANNTEKVLLALSEDNLAYLSVDVVIGVNHFNLQSIKNIVSRRPGTTIHYALPSLMGLMARADLVIGAGGATTWEKFTLGVPSISISVASNQDRTISSLSKDELHISGNIKTSNDWNHVIQNAVKNPTLLQNLSKKSRDLVDGLGVFRVIRAIISINNLSIVYKITHEDENNKLYHFLEDASGLPLGSAALNFDKIKSVVKVDLNIDDSLFFINELDKLLFSKMLEKLRGFYIINSKLKIHPKIQKSSLNKSNYPVRLTILCDDSSWIIPMVNNLQKKWINDGRLVQVIHNHKLLSDGDVCFILSYSKIINKAQLNLNTHNLVVHADNLPYGRGWSPMSWQILNGSDRVCVTLFEADLDVDSGPIYAQKWIELDGTELVNEWRFKLSKVTESICIDWVNNFPESASWARAQEGEATYWPRRSKDDSLVDIDKTIKEQFNLLRIVDNDSYPAYFEHLQRKYKLRIEKF